jgi:hypothetical protein
MRLQTGLWSALKAEARRRRRWTSDLVEECVQEGLARRGALVGTEDTDPTPTPLPSHERHWVRLAVPGPVWEFLQCEASMHRISVPQLIQQKVYQVVMDGHDPSHFAQ